MNCVNCGKELREGLRFCPACGTAAPQGAAYVPPPPGQMNASWSPAPAPPRRKSRAGRILLIVFGVLVLLAGGAGVALYYGVRHFANTMRSSEPFQLAEKELRENPVAKEVLGEIKSIGFPLGGYDAQPDGSGKAGFTTSVEGTRGRGQYMVSLSREGGVWRVKTALLRMSDGNAHDLTADGGGGEGEDVEVGVAPPAPRGSVSETVKVPGAVEGGALDEKAVSRPEPPYPSVARAAKAKGTVVVRVTVDESGQVIMASPASGHPLLQAAAVAAARQARFAPTLKQGEPVKVVGTLTYKFE
jgi:TonB family protein